MENAQAIIDAVRAARPHEIVETIGAVKHVFVPGFGDHASKIERVDLEAGAATPMRKRGIVQVFDAASLNAAIASNAGAGDVAIYIDRNPEKPAVVAVMNGNGPGGAGWGDFRIEIAFRQTPQWAKWKANDGKLLGQTDFAEFIEDNLDDIAEPAGADMLEIAQYLQATRQVDFRSGIRLSSGQVQFQNVENIEAKVGSGQVAIPETFTLGISPLFGVPSYRVPVRFRYRIVEGKLKLGYKLQRLETMMETIMNEVETQITVGDHAQVLHGVAPAPTK